MKTITESQVQVNGASLQVELTNAASVATPICALLCPDTAVVAQAPVYTTQLRGYTR